jgi:hypothetical protein
LKNRDIGLRAQDIQTGLQDVAISGPAAGVFDTTLIAGMAARLAVHIRGVDVIQEPDRIYAVADRLGIPSMVLPAVLDTLEEAEFATVEYKDKRPIKVMDRVPLFGGVYERVGEIWLARKPREEEVATVELLNELADGPKGLESIRKASSLKKQQLDLVREVGTAGGYFSEFAPDVKKETVVFSPLYWEENPEQTFELFTRWGGDQLSSAIKRVKASQGLPLPDTAASANAGDQVLLDAMVAGLLPSPEVTSRNGAKRFAFTPYNGQIGLDSYERAILQKARALLACVRYGQYFGSVTRIGDPGAIINALRQRGRIGSHSEIPQQYATLVVEGIARLSPDTQRQGRYYLHLIDTEENKKALRLAADLLSEGEAIAERGIDRQAREVLFAAGRVKDPLTTRSDEVVRRTKMPKFDRSFFDSELAKLIDQVRQP